MRRMPIDFVIPIIIAGAVGALVNYAGGKWIDQKEEQSKEEVYSDTMIGAAATENVPVVKSIAEMFEEDCFTFHCEDTMTGIGQSAYYDGVVYDIYELESGETVVVDDYFYNVYYDHEESSSKWGGFSDMYAVMPVGRVVKEPVPEELIEKFEEEGYTITDPSFYVDMRGDFEFFSREDYENKLGAVVAVVAICVFCIIRYILIASGIFSPLIPLRFLKKWKRFIIYYNTIYYDENIKQILDYRKQGKMEEAAREFCRLTDTEMEEAMEAMDIWDEIYGEGILQMAGK